MRIDITGKKYGRLTVKGIYDKLPSGAVRWKCECDCGAIVPELKSVLERNNGTIKSCGCVYADELRKEIGKKKDYFTIVGVKQYGRKSRLLVKCECGHIEEMNLSTFNRGLRCQSCGRDKIKRGADDSKYKHGLSRSRIYNIYRGMCSRCYDESNASFSTYGNKGISVCKEWLGEEGLLNFYDWAMANGYSDELTLDRKNNNMGYSPENCRWATQKFQSNHKTNNRYYEIDGIEKTITEWCEEYGILCAQTVFSRIKRGMDIKTALTKPIRKKHSEMSEEELQKLKKHRYEMDKKWRDSHKEQIQISRDKWKRNNPEKDRESKRKYEERKRKTHK